MSTEKKFTEINSIITMPCHWSVGPYMQKFYDEMANKKIVGVKCKKCGTVYVPPRALCGACWQKLSDWKEVKDQGKVENFVVAHVDIRENPLKEPQIIALIKLEGAGTSVFGEIKGIEPGKVKTGLKVRAVWAQETKGRVSDITHYEPV